MDNAAAGSEAEAPAHREVNIRTRYPAAEPEFLAEVVRAVLLAERGRVSAEGRRLLAEVEELGRTIADARSEIAAIGAEALTVRDIPLATDELDAIVAHTASATETILESCERLDAVATVLDDAGAARLHASTTRIYEACSFQDITGQRIAKVVLTLKAIERKVADIVLRFARRDARAGAAASAETRLLNGPQLPTVAMDQSGVDALLASLE